MWLCIVTYFFIIKPTRCANFTNLFCHETLHVSDSSSVHHQQFIHCTLSSGICHTGTVHTAFEQNLVLLDNYLQMCVTYAIDECTVKNSWWRTEELSETCRVSCQNKFVKLAHLVGFIIKKSESLVFAKFSPPIMKSSQGWHNHCRIECVHFSLSSEDNRNMQVWWTDI
jgi:hypothetical protein